MVIVSLEEIRDEIIFPSTLSASEITISDNNNIMSDEVLLSDNIITTSNNDIVLPSSEITNFPLQNDVDFDSDENSMLRKKNENQINDIFNNNNESNLLDHIVDEQRQNSFSDPNITRTPTTTTTTITTNNKQTDDFVLQQIFEINDTIDTVVGSDFNNEIPKFEVMRSFLESEFVPEEFWHLQRDSFIHRSYNEKLLAQKNEADSLINRNYNNNGNATNSAKRDSFIKNSFNSIRRSFSSGKKKQRNSALLLVPSENGGGEDECGSGERDLSEQNSDNSNMDEKCDYVIDDHLLNPILRNMMDSNRRNSSSSSCASHRSTNSVGLGFRSAPTTPMAPLQGQTDNHVQNVGNLNSLSRSPSHSTTKLDSRSSKQLSTSAPVGASSPHPTKSSSTTAASTALAATSTATTSLAVSNGNATNNQSKNENPPVKEKKRKELSSGRQKKFHRHFQQVASDERVINYFSCALVSDILLQGHLYITENYFAFYSNVFGFVTKLLIPTVSVVKISKEKTAKIIPNAVGVATSDERHVFGSFMSREAAFRLMLSVWRPVAPVEPEIIPKLPDVEISECSIEDDSSSAISGNESPPRVQESTTSDASHSLRHRTTTTSNDISSGGGGVGSNCLKSNDIIDIPVNKVIETAIQSTNMHESRSTSPMPKIVPIGRFSQIHLPANIHILYIGVVLAVLLALFSGFLFFRIMDAQTKANHNYNPLDFKWDASNKDIDVYAEVLKWQKQMQTKSVDEAQIILNSNLEQIARVRKSLETLSILIHDKNAPILTDRPMASENYVSDKDSPLDVPSFGSSSSSKS